MKFIKKIKLHNFKRFERFSVELDNKLNILVGDNESGKSSIIEAINLALSGNRSRVETAGLENLFNSTVIDLFLSSTKRFEDLPTLFIELYFNDLGNHELNGNNNSDGVVCDGLKLEIIPNDELSRDIRDILRQADPAFPFEFYSIRFMTFSGEVYSGYKKYLRHILIDNSQISSEYAIKEYVKDMYNSFAGTTEKNSFQNEYRKHKTAFKNSTLTALNGRVASYEFSIRSNSKSSLETDLILTENNISIENKGKGIQCFIKTAFALARSRSNLDIVLLEEPENHLSHINMKKLIQEIRSASEKQIILSTHSNLISTRLNLRNSILLNNNSFAPVLLKTIDPETAKFFIKAPDNNILEFVLSKKVILVEGDAEFILMEQFFKIVTGRNLENSDIHVISVDGTSFKRYLSIAEKLNIRTAVITDNDGDYQNNCIDKYDDFSAFDFIKVFADTDNSVKTFEISMYQKNTAICDEIFLPGRRTLNAQEYMLNNKTEAAFQLLEKKSSSIVVPTYIKEAIEWINR